MSAKRFRGLSQRRSAVGRFQGAGFNLKGKAMRRGWGRAALAALLAGGVLAACDNDGPAERAGEKIDDAARNVGEGLRDAGREIQRKAD
jgi:hypothetical protein